MQTKTTHELEVGDVVLTHGMRVLIDTPPTGEGLRRGALACDGLVLNYDRLRSSVPRHWLDRADGSHRWLVQGNELAYWFVDDSALAALEVSQAGVGA